MQKPLGLKGLRDEAIILGAQDKSHHGQSMGIGGLERVGSVLGGGRLFEILFSEL